MRYIYILVMLFTFAALANVEAQGSNSRLQKQHNVTRFMKDHLASSIEMTARALEDKQYNMRLSALQTIRELEQLFPEESFSRLVKPLISIINDKNLEPESRVLAAITLDMLHSETGDAAIFMAGEKCDNPTLKNVCQAITRFSADNFPKSAQLK